jgi:hypothetical protein
MKKLTDVARECGLAMKIVLRDVPDCCERHAINHVRHEGTTYDDVIQLWHQSTHRRSTIAAMVDELKDVLNDRIDDALLEADIYVDAADCGQSSHADVRFAEGQRNWGWKR